MRWPSAIERQVFDVKKIYLNLKRFDVPIEFGGVNRISPIRIWGADIINRVQDDLGLYKGQTEFFQFFPEAHLIPALSALKPGSQLQIGAQSVCREDTSPGGNFGALTGDRPAAALAALGCSCMLVGHCEERRDLAGILSEAGISNADAINRLLNKSIRRATARGLKVLYCIGEKAEEQASWQEILGSQLAIALDGVDQNLVTIAYEPIWSIGPGKTPADKPYITKIARFIKEQTGNLPVVYGGGLKADNAAMLASIPEIDGGLIALTRFSGEIGFYPEEYLEIIRIYLDSMKEGA